MSWEPINIYGCRKGECSTDTMVKRDYKNIRRVLANVAATDEESIEEMVPRFERELDK